LYADHYFAQLGEGTSDRRRQSSHIDAARIVAAAARAVNNDCSSSVVVLLPCGQQNDPQKRKVTMLPFVLSLSKGQTENGVVRNS